MWQERCVRGLSDVWLCVCTHAMKGRLIACVACDVGHEIGLRDGMEVVTNLKQGDGQLGGGVGVDVGGGESGGEAAEEALGVVPAREDVLGPALHLFDWLVELGVCPCEIVAWFAIGRQTRLPTHDTRIRTPSSPITTSLALSWVAASHASISAAAFTPPRRESPEVEDMPCGVGSGREKGRPRVLSVRRGRERQRVKTTKISSRLWQLASYQYRGYRQSRKTHVHCCAGLSTYLQAAGLVHAGLRGLEVAAEVLGRGRADLWVFVCYKGVRGEWMCASDVKRDTVHAFNP